MSDDGQRKKKLTAIKFAAAVIILRIYNAKHPVTRTRTLILLLLILLLLYDGRNAFKSL